MDYLQKEIKDAYRWIICGKNNSYEDLKSFLNDYFKITLDDGNYEIDNLDLDKLRIKVVDNNNTSHYYYAYYTGDYRFSDIIPEYQGQSYIGVKEYNDGYTDEKIYSTYNDRYYARRISLIDGDYRLSFDRYCRKSGGDRVDKYDIIYHLCDLPNAVEWQDLLRKIYQENLLGSRRRDLKQECTYSLGWCHVEKKDRYHNYCYCEDDGVIYGINECSSELSDIDYMRGVCFEDFHRFCAGDGYEDYLPIGGIYSDGVSDIGDKYVDSKIYFCAFDNNHNTHVLEINKVGKKIKGKYTLINHEKIDDIRQEQSEFVIPGSNGDINFDDIKMINEYLSDNYENDVMAFFAKKIGEFGKALDHQDFFEENTKDSLLNPGTLIKLDDEKIKRLVVSRKDELLKSIDDEFCLKTGTEKNELGKARIKIKK